MRTRLWNSCPSGPSAGSWSRRSMLARSRSYSPASIAARRFSTTTACPSIWPKPESHPEDIEAIIMTSADAILIIGDRDPERLERSWSYPPTNFHRKTIAICMGVSEGEAEVLTQQDIPVVDRIFPHDHRMFGDKLHLHPQHVRYSHYLGGTTSAGNRSPV